MKFIIRMWGRIIRDGRRDDDRIQMGGKMRHRIYSVINTII